MWAAAYLTYPHIDPVLFSIGPLAVRWYALAYIAGIWCAYAYIGLLNRRLPTPLLSPKQREDLVMWAIIGIILGGRLGYVLIYKPDYYLANPSEIIAIWKGGMSFHGGLVGVIVSFFLFARKQHLPFLPMMDLVAAAAPIGLCFGRLANFINGELVGRAANVPWAMIFSHIDEVPRHPSQLYQAGMEGVLLFALLWLLVRHGKSLAYSGRTAGVFLTGYAIARAVGEHFRQPDAQIGFLAGGVTMGQILCLPMLLIGLYLIFKSIKHTKTT